MAKQITIDSYSVKQVVITSDKAVVLYAPVTSEGELGTKTLQIDLPKSTADLLTEKVLDKIKVHENDV